MVDASGKMNGRGTYVCANDSCCMNQKARKQLSAALKIEINEQEFEFFQKKLNSHLEFLNRIQKTKQ